MLPVILAPTITTIYERIQHSSIRVYIKYKHEAKWRCLHTLFGSKEEAETYAKSQFAVEAWELRRFQLTEEQLKKLEYVDQFCAEHEADREAEKGPQRLQ